MYIVCLFSIVRFEVSWDSGSDDDVIEFNHRRMGHGFRFLLINIQKMKNNILPPLTKQTIYVHTCT
jgi:hypothetical protein